MLATGLPAMDIQLKHGGLPGLPPRSDGGRVSRSDGSGGCIGRRRTRLLGSGERPNSVSRFEFEWRASDLPDILRSRARRIVVKRPASVLGKSRRCNVMAARKSEAKGARKSGGGFSEEERAAMRESSAERRIAWGRNKAEDERAVLAKISGFPEPDRSMGQRLHAIVKKAGPGLSPRLWYGMPAYSKDGDVVCFFQPAHKFK